jgi:soluble lytic murein transglycosylase-like protein
MHRADFRTICDCQRHAQRWRFWRRPFGVALTATEQLRRGGAVVLLGVPLAVGAIGIPSEAMNAGFPRVGVQAIERRELPVFTTAKTRREFLAARPVRRELTIEIAKEEFFRTSVPYGSIIYREAIRNGLAPELVAAVVQAESDFRVGLVSGKDARGLMQIVPETGRLLGAENLFNPEENITAGAKYLRYLIDRFRDPRIALAAYNAGEGNVEKWGGIPPFPETVRYLARVNEHARDYRFRIHETYVASLRTVPASVH